MGVKMKEKYGFSIKDELEPYEIEQMEYGIINRFNFRSLDLIPIKDGTLFLLLL